MVKMTRYQWLLIALLSANFGVVFFDRNTAPTLEWLMQLMKNRPKVTSEDGGAQ